MVTNQDQPIRQMFQNITYYIKHIICCKGYALYRSRFLSKTFPLRSSEQLSKWQETGKYNQLEQRKLDSLIRIPHNMDHIYQFPQSPLIGP